jgi:hypothetical protein
MRDDLDEKDPKSLDDKELLELLKKKVDSWYSFFKDNIVDGRERKRFAFGDQWEDQTAEEYKNTGKVMLTTNKLNPYIRRLVSEIKTFTPQGAVSRVDDTAQSSELAKALENKLRKISLKSNSKNAYQVAFRDGLTCGYGAISASLDYASNKTFRQEVGTSCLMFPARVGFDPAATKITKYDGDYSFDYTSMTKNEFKNTYGFIPESSQPFVSTFSLEDGRAFNIDWITEDRICVFDFYLKEYFDVNLVKLQNGAEMTRKQYNEMVDIINKIEEETPGQVNQAVFDEMKIVQKRKAKDYKIRNYKFIADQILDRKKWPSKYLPHVFMDGDSYFLEGKQHMQPFVKDAVDSQRMLNFINSEIIQNIKDANNEDYLVTPANIKGKDIQKMWKDKRRRKGVLVATPDPKNGWMPQKQSPSQINPQLHPLSVKLEQDIRSSLGVFQSNEGSSDGELSGKAEIVRVMQGDKSNSVFADNLIAAIEQLMRIQVDLIRNTALDTQALDGVDESGNETSVPINKPLPFGGVLNDISEGEYNVEIKVSSGFTMQKMNEYREILSYVGAFPQMQQVIPDIAAQKLTTNESIDIANRAKTMLPLPIQAQDKGNPQGAAMAKHQMQQQQQIQKMMQQMQVQAEQIKMLTEKQKGDSAERTSQANMMNAQTNRMTEAGKAQIEAAKLQTEQQKAAMDLERERIKATASMVQ